MGKILNQKKRLESTTIWSDQQREECMTILSNSASLNLNPTTPQKKCSLGLFQIDVTEMMLTYHWQPYLQCNMFAQHYAN